jgi:haloalkane dehalogenase
MKFIKPSAGELANLRGDPLLVEQELDVRPEVAYAIEKATGIRAGRVYWQSEHEYLYALELGDLGKGCPSMATVYGFWDCYEPRPPEHEIDADLLDFLVWFAGITGNINPDDVTKVAEFTRQQTGCCQVTWPVGSVLRTPNERFANLPGFDYEPHYVEVEGLRMAYYETGTGDPILCMHGEPMWGYLYRRMMPVLSQVGRVIVPDLIGFGRSDKPVAENAYSYKSHVRWMKRFLATMDSKNITIVTQDWGGSIGLRLVADMPERFKRVVMMNTGIPSGYPFGDAFATWRRLSQDQVFMDVPTLVKISLQRQLTDPEYAAYGAPFPSKEYGRGALVFPRLVPIRPDHPGTYDNLIAIEKLRKLDIPALLFWGDKDDITKLGVYALRSIFKTANEPIIIKGAGHFIQEDAGEEVAGKILEWIRRLSHKDR